MSRTFRRDRWNEYKKVPDGKQCYRCKCNWCINIPYKDRYGLTVKEKSIIMIIKNYTNKEYKKENRKLYPEWDRWFEDYWSKKSNIWSFKYREYRSWKYNRKTQYK